MSQFTARIKKISVWKNLKGEFVSFEECPGTFWKWGVSGEAAGTLMRCVTVVQQLGSSGDNQRLSEFENLDDAGQHHLSIMPMQKSALPEVAGALGGMVQGGKEKLPAYTEKIDADAAILKQAQSIREIQQALGRLQVWKDSTDVKLSQIEVLARNGGQI